MVERGTHLAAGLCIALAGCGHGNRAQADLSNTGAARSNEPRISEQDPSSLEKRTGNYDCFARGEPRPEYVAPLVAFVKTHMLGEHQHLGETVVFTPSPSSPYLRIRDVSTKRPPADEVHVGVHSRSVAGELVLVKDGWAGMYCIYVDERSSPPSLTIDLVIAAIE